MAAVMVVGSPPEPDLDPLALARELSQLHIILLGVKADVEDVLSLVRPPGSAADLKQGVSRAIACVSALRERLQEG